MPYFTVIARQNGQIELLQGDAAEDVELGDGDKKLGEFHAETDTEAKRQLATTNPSIDMDTMRVRVDADADAALADQKAKFLEGVRKKAIDDLELPDDTGAPDETEDVEEEDPESGEKKIKKVKKAKKPVSHKKIK